MRWSVALLAALLFGSVGGCSGSGDDVNPLDMHVSVDQAVPNLGGVDVTGRWASMLTLDTGAGPLELMTIWTAYEPQASTNIPIATTWLLCALPIPGFLDVPYQVLEAGSTMATGTLASRQEGAAFVQPTVAFVLGAQLKDPVNDPLPTDPKNLCADSSATGCVQPNVITGGPGLSVSAHGLHPDADLLYVVLRARWSIDATANSMGSLDGKVTQASIELHVLGCRLSGGATCSASDVAAIEKLHAPITISGGTVRSHAQGGYFNCPQFINDPVGSSTGIELQDADIAQLPPQTFSKDVQPDIDAMGCATGGCHETFAAPKLHLIPTPTMMSDIMANYQAVLPWTQVPWPMGNPMPGGRFVNEFPLPTAMRARWLQWEAESTPY